MNLSQQPGESGCLAAQDPLAQFQRHGGEVQPLRNGPDGGLYYGAHPIEQMRYPLTMLVYDMNDAPPSYGHGVC